MFNFMKIIFFWFRGRDDFFTDVENVIPVIFDYVIVTLMNL